MMWLDLYLMYPHPMSLPGLTGQSRSFPLSVLQRSATFPPLRSDKIPPLYFLINKFEIIFQIPLNFCQDLLSNFIANFEHFFTDNVRNSQVIFGISPSTFVIICLKTDQRVVGFNLSKPPFFNNSSMKGQALSFTLLPDQPSF